jgi:hypothetical protein
VAFAVLFLPWALGVPPQVLIDQLVVHPTSVLPEARRVPLPGPVPPSDTLASFYAWLYFYFVLAVALAGVVILGLRRRLVTGPGTTARDGWLIRLGVLVLLLTHIAPMTGRWDMPHALPTLTLAVALAALLVPWGGVETARSSVKVGVSAVLVLLAIWPTLKLMGTLTETPPWRCADSLPRARCVNLNPDELRAVQLVQERTSPGDPLFVGTTRHDKVLYNEALFYFLAERPVATRYHEYSPLVTDTLSVQREMVRDLERAQPPWVVLVDIPESTEDNASSHSSGVVVLDEWIREHYVPDTTVGDYQLWRLNEG